MSHWNSRRRGEKEGDKNISKNNGPDFSRPDQNYNLTDLFFLCCASSQELHIRYIEIKQHNIIIIALITPDPVLKASQVVIHTVSQTEERGTIFIPILQIRHRFPGILSSVLNGAQVWSGSRTQTHEIRLQHLSCTVRPLFHL